jgi:hypothetical protein
MRRVRANLRYGSWCALFAVAIHIIVSFGHAHRIDAFRQGEFLPRAAAVINGQSAIDPGDPASKPIGLAFEYCAICAVINMGASMVPAEAPASAVPAIVSQVRFAPRADSGIRASGHLLFQARAPPFA